MATSIKIFEGVKLYYDGEIFTLEGPVDIWDWFKDKYITLTEEQKTTITTELFCFHHQDIQLTNGKHIILDIIPVKEV